MDEDGNGEKETKKGGKGVRCVGSVVGVQAGVKECGDDAQRDRGVR